jgi:hypothetical protein
MSNETNLKSQNITSLWMLLSFNVLMLMIVFFAENFKNIETNYQSFINIRLGGIVIAPLVIFILNGIISSNQKASLIFFRLKDILPGCRAFSEHAPSDYRIDITKLSEKYGELPSSGKEQNVLWYKIYKTHSNNPAILKSHKDFLLARDLTSLSFLFLIVLGLPSLFFATITFKWVYFLILLVQYFILLILARNHGYRFVVNVLAEESATL